MSGRWRVSVPANVPPSQRERYAGQYALDTMAGLNIMNELFTGSYDIDPGVLEFLNWQNYPEKMQRWYRILTRMQSYTWSQEAWERRRRKVTRVTLPTLFEHLIACFEPPMPRPLCLDGLRC